MGGRTPIFTLVLDHKADYLQLHQWRGRSLAGIDLLAASEQLLLGAQLASLIYQTSCVITGIDHNANSITY